MTSTATTAPHPTTLNVLGTLISFKLRAADTQGAYSLFEASVPDGAGTPPHLQTQEEEAFVGLEGEVNFLVGDAQLHLTPGQVAIVPRGTPHAFQNTCGRTARMLILVSPGGRHERFFEEMGTAVDAPPAELDIPKLMAAAARADMQILPPRD